MGLELAQCSKGHAKIDRSERTAFNEALFPTVRIGHFFDLVTAAREK